MPPVESLPHPPVPLGPTRPAGRRAVRLLAAGAAVLALGATFSAYLSPGLALDLGQLMLLCGFR